MSSLLKCSAILLAMVFAAAAPARADEAHPPGYYGIGRAPTPVEINGWAIAVRPDGQGLPPGKGSVNQGADIFADQCAACHGTFGEGEGRYPKLAAATSRVIDPSRPSAPTGLSPPPCGITSTGRCRSRRRTRSRPIRSMP